MKFSQNTSVVSPNTIGNVRREVPREELAFGQGGKEWDALTGAMGQIIKVAQKEQDDRDAADVMDARNKIMTSLTQSMYGEDGLLTKGVGENARGLTDRATKTVQATFDAYSKGYNKRVQRALKGNLSENMGNFQRIAAQQETREFQKQKETDYNSGIALDVDTAGAGWQDSATVDNAFMDAQRLLSYRAVDMGWSPQQTVAATRDLYTSIYGTAIDRAIENEDYETADIMLQQHKAQMLSKVAASYEGKLRTQKQLIEVRNMGASIAEQAGGDPNKVHELIFGRGGAIDQTQTITSGGGSGSYSGDSAIDGYINGSAQKYGIDPAYVAAMASIESGYSQDATSSAGARGIMQLMPSTAAGLGVNPDDAAQNIEGGAKYLAQLYQKYGDIDLAVAAYNAGEGAVDEYGGIPPYPETQNHVKKFHEALDEIRAKNKGGGNALGVAPVWMGSQAGIDAQVQRLKPAWKDGVLGTVGGVLNQYGISGVVSSGARSKEHNAEVNGSPTSHHIDDGSGGDAVDIVLSKPDGSAVTSGEAEQVKQAFEATGKFDEVLFHDAGSGYHLHLGGYKGGLGTQGANGGTSRTVPKWSRKELDDMERYALASLQDAKQRQDYADKQKLDGYLQQMQQMKAAGNTAGIVALAAQVGTTEKTEIYSKVLSAAKLYAPEAYQKTRSGTGNGSSTRRYYYGDSGARYTANQIEDDKATYEEYLELTNDPDATITDAQQRRFDKAARHLNDAHVTVEGVDGSAMAITKHALEVNNGDEEAAWYLQQPENGGFSSDEAYDYIRAAHKEGF